MMIRLTTFSVCLLLLAACASSPLPRTTASFNNTVSQDTVMTPSPLSLPPLQVTPEAIAAQLEDVTTLSAAAAQLAAALAIAPDQIRVRIKSTECMVCGMDEPEAKSSAEGISVAEAVQEIKPYDLLWLFVQKLTCAYYFDGKTFTPRGCQLAPL